MGHTTEEINIGDPSEVLMNIRVKRVEAEICRAFKR